MKFFFTYLFCISLICLKCQNDSISPPLISSPQVYNIVYKSNPFTAFLGPIPFTGEYRLAVDIPITKDQSLQTSLSYLGKSILFALLEDTAFGNQLKFIIYGYRLQLTYKFYPAAFRFNNNKNVNLSPLGFYAGPHISYSYARISTPYLNRYGLYMSAEHFNIDLLAGYQFELLEPVIIDIFAGLGYKKNIWYEYYSPGKKRVISRPFDFPPYYWDLKIMLGFNIGIGL